MGFFDIFRKKKKPELSEEDLKWNKMWDLWVKDKADSPYAELMTYLSEVNNGGHYQYYDNVSGVGDLTKEMSELEKILPEKLKINMQNGYKEYLILEENDDDEAEERLDHCDDVYHQNKEEINQILREYASSMEL